MRDQRFPADSAVERIYGLRPRTTGEEGEWHDLRVAYGIAESGADYALSEAFPHDVLLEQLGGVGLRKGCYVGQEVVSRMQHRGTARRRVLLVKADGPLPSSGTDITANGRSVGTLGTVAGNRGLAIARIDRVKDAMDGGIPLLADGLPVELSIPPWATFTFSEHAAGAEEA